MTDVPAWNRLKGINSTQNSYDINLPWDVLG